MKKADDRAAPHNSRPHTPCEQLIEQRRSVFERGGGQAVQAAETFERERTQLHSKIGELTVQVDFLQRKSRQLALSDALPTWLKKDTRR